MNPIVAAALSPRASARKAAPTRGAWSARVRARSESALTASPLLSPLRLSSRRAAARSPPYSATHPATWSSSPSAPAATSAAFARARSPAITQPRAMKPDARRRVTGSTHWPCATTSASASDGLPIAASARTRTGITRCASAVESSPRDASSARSSAVLGSPARTLAFAARSATVLDGRTASAETIASRAIAHSPSASA